MNPLLLRGLSLLAAFGIGMLLAPPSEKQLPSPTLGHDGWQPPELPRKPDQAAQALALVNSPMFEPELRSPSAVQDAAPPPDERWRIAGLLGRGNERRALISFADQSRAAEILKVGEKLPSGHRIERIEEGAVCVRVGRKIVRIGVEASD